MARSLRYQYGLVVSCMLRVSFLKTKHKFLKYELDLGLLTTLFLRELLYINRYKDGNIEKALEFLSNGITVMLQ